MVGDLVFQSGASVGGAVAGFLAGEGFDGAGVDGGGGAVADGLEGGDRGLVGVGSDPFSQTGVTPLLIEADIQPSVTRWAGQADLSEWYRYGQNAGNNITASVPRSSLWQAAAKMFAEHPLGVGPDNYRLEYGKYLGASHWDTRIYSNNLYLEILTGSGILGVAAFGLVMLSVRWRLEPACLSIAVFFVHGLVDVFLMATPIYFAFWILMGNSGTDV